MKIAICCPPLYPEIDQAFNIEGKSIIFAWGDTIYNPTGVDIPPHLIAHEEEHGRRQGDDVEGWWRKYMVDATFRLEEEIVAHRAEYNYFVDDGAPRQKRRRMLKLIAKRLSSGLYGRMLTYAEAKDHILSKEPEDE